MAQVEGTVAAQAQGPPAWGRSTRRRAAVPTIVVAAVLAMTGLVLLPTRVLIGSLTLLACVALLAIGALLRYARPRGQK